MSKIKIFHLITGLERGGAEILLTEFLPLLSKDKFEVSVGYLRGKGTLARVIEAKGIKAYCFGMRSRYDLLVLMKITKFIKKNRFDIIHTHLIDADIFGFFAARLAGVPVVLSTKHNTDNFRKTKSLAVFLDSLIANLSNRIIAVSNSVRDFMVKYQKISPSKITVVRNGIDFKKFLSGNDKSKIREKLNLNSQAFIVGTVARFDEQKGHIYLVEAIPRILDKINNVYFLFVGEGVLRQQIENRVKMLNIENNVKFFNAIDNVSDVLHSLDLFVLPSVWEGFGLVLLEAQAAEVAVIASDIDGIKEVIEDGETGILVPPANSEVLADRIIQVLSDKNLRNRLSVNGQNSVKERFDIKVMTKKIESIYKNLHLKS
ncbi:MAG: glycosyltransferase [Candidatus Omnitrophica bacterium]|nr:glycosyltransferase [Candidatus Omnitrophota bacterium]